MIVAIGADHAGFEMRDLLIEFLSEKGIEVHLVETPYTEQGVDYPDIAHTLVELLLQNYCQLGILICGTGIGMSITANRYKGIRAALCNTEIQAQLAREHNHSNILCLGARIIGNELAKSIVEKFIYSSPSHETRHQRRIDKIERV